MGINKVQYGNTVLIDLTDATATADKILQGYTAYGRDGSKLTGTATGGGGSGDGYVWQDQDGYVHLSDEEGTQITVESLSVTQNGTYTAPSGKAYSPVTVNVSGGGGGSSDFKGVLEGTATNPTLPSDLVSLRDFAFYQYTNLALTELPNSLTTIGNYAFYLCTNLALTELPNSLTAIGSYAFYQGANVALTELPSGVTVIAPYAFYQCANLALTELPSGVTAINQYAFYQCPKIALSSLPSGVTTIDQYAFARCSGLDSISCDGIITVLSANAFVGSASYQMQLKSVSFPNMALASNLGTAFGSTTANNACKELEVADIGKTTGIAANAFANCYKLQTLVLRKPTVCTLANVSALLNTPMRGYNSLTGTVYVPNDLIGSYQTATNWSTLYNNGTVTFVAIEGSEYEL